MNSGSCSKSHLQPRDKAAQEHGRQHNKSIQLLPDMGWDHLALTCLHLGQLLTRQYKHTERSR
jgi:hypothetical protein